MTGTLAPHRRSPYPLLACLGLLVAGCTLRFARITAQSLWLDEGYTLDYARIATVPEVMRHVLDCRSTECSSPLYPILLHGIIQLFGESPLVLRGFSGLCGAAMLVGMIWVARKLFDWPAGLLTGTLTCISAFSVWYSQDTRAYSLLLLLVTAELCGLALCLETTSGAPLWKHRLILALAVAVGVFGSILFALGAVALSVSHILLTRDRRHWWTTWWPATLAALPGVVYYGLAQAGGAATTPTYTPLGQSGLMNLIYTLYGQLVGLTFGPPQVELREADKLLVLRGYGLPLVCTGALALVLIVAIVVAVRHRVSSDSRWKNAQMLALSVLIGAGLAIAVVLVTGINWQPRHAFFLFPPAVLFVSFCLAQLAQRRAIAARLFVAIALVLFAITNLWSLYNYFEVPKYGKDDYRGAAIYLMEAQRAGHQTALLNGVIVLLRYYGDSATVNLDNTREPKLVVRLKQLSEPRGEVLVALNRSFSWQRGRSVKAVLDSVFEVQDHRQLQYFDFYRLLRRH